ncbi:MAG: 30S ribosomal protein S16 [Pyrinomonadaceae bacterium]
MLAISLMRMGAKKRPFYRVVVKEKRSKRDGKYLENLGTYDPLADPADVKLNHDRIQYWIGVGAQPSETVSSLIKANPVLTDEEREAMMAARAEKKAAAEAAKAEAKRAEAERLAAEKAEADKAAAAEAEAAKAAEAPAEAESTPADEVADTASAEAAPVEAAPAAEEAPVAEEAPAVETADAEPTAETKEEGETAA